VGTLLKPKFIKIIYKNSAPNSKKTHSVSIIMTNRLLLLRETVTVYCWNHKKLINLLRGKSHGILTLKQVVILYIVTAIYSYL
jgi:hypothetical protein